MKQATAEPRAREPEIDPADLRLVVTQQARGHRVGRLVGWCSEDGPEVDYPGNPHGPLLARSVVPLDEVEALSLISGQREVLLTFDAERSDSPIIVGLLQPTPREARDRQTANPDSVDARVAGGRVRVEGQDEIAFRCGKASIHLHADGRVYLRGVDIVTRATRNNRIKGGTVGIN